MKFKKFIATTMALSMVLTFSGCTSKSSDADKNSSSTQSSTTTTTKNDSSDDLNARLDALYQQENELFAEHQDAWNKFFGLMNKDAAASETEENYADFLAKTVEANKDSFTEEELDTLNKDIEQIRGIEEEIAKLSKESSASDKSASDKSDSSSSVFSGFAGKDLDGNDVDESLFSKNAVTVVNFWFSGCKPCVAELPELNKLNETLKEMGGEVVGINTETLDDNQDGIKEAKKILEKQGASYRNLTFDSNSELGKYAGNIVAFPTTILVDRNGNIVGEPLLGGIDEQKNYDSLMKQIQSVIDADTAASK